MRTSCQPERDPINLTGHLHQINYRDLALTVFNWSSLHVFSRDDCTADMIILGKQAGLVFAGHSLMVDHLPWEASFCVLIDIRTERKLLRMRGIPLDSLRVSTLKPIMSDWVQILVMHITNPYVFHLKDLGGLLKAPRCPPRRHFCRTAFLPH